MAALPRMVKAFARDLARAADGALKAVADPAKAGPMQAYMKNVQNYLGVASPERAALFKETLEQAGIPCTIRMKRGIDIQAGCGQLAGGVSS